MDTVLHVQRWFDGSRLIDSPVWIRIAAGRIARVGGSEIAGPSADVVAFDRDAILSPGFIDTHSHSDFSLVDDPRAVGAVMQGITTQVVGQCGFSAAPLRSHRGDQAEAVADDPTSMPTADQPAWQSFAGYRSCMDEARPAINVVPFVGHNTLIRALNDADPVRVSDLADRALAEGARGVSTGLSYQLGRRSTDEGVAGLAETAERHRVPYHTHMRYSEEETLNTLERTLDLLVGRCSKVTISHVFPRVRDRATTVNSLIAAIDRRAPEFDSLTFDVTVYDTGGTPWTQGLPRWAIGTDFEYLAKQAADRSWRESVLLHLAEEAEGWVVDWANLYITKVNKVHHRDVLGRSIADLAAGSGVLPERFAIDLLRNDGHFWVSPPNKRWRDVLDLLTSDRCIPMVDGMTVDPRRPDGVVALERSWNAYRRFLKYAVPEAPMELETALRKLTSDAAERLQLRDRGVIAQGACADLTVLDHAGLEELSGPDFDLRERGIEAVMVNGQWVLNPNQALTKARPGMVL